MRRILRLTSKVGGMAMDFLSADELKKIFHVLGSFYNLRLNDGSIVKCRNQLNIIEREYLKINSNSLEQAKIDLLVIMMNPGSSRPLDENYKIKTFNVEIASELIKNNNKVQAKPDNTQYQVMRIMREKGFKHALVVNLSDLREPKSKEFFKIIKGKCPSIHSLFSEERAVERDSLFLQNVPVLCAWGKDACLKPLADRCCNFISDKRSVGVWEKGTHLCKHASPTLQEHKIKWLEEISDML